MRHQGVSRTTNRVTAALIRRAGTAGWSLICCGAPLRCTVCRSRGGPPPGGRAISGRAVALALGYEDELEAGPVGSVADLLESKPCDIEGLAGLAQGSKGRVGSERYAAQPEEE